MPRYQVPMFLCIDALDEVAAAAIAARVEHADLAFIADRDPTLFQCQLLPIVKIPQDEEDPEDLEAAVHLFMES